MRTAFTASQQLMRNPLYARMMARPSVNGTRLVNACLMASLGRLHNRGCWPGVLGRLGSYLRSEILIDTHFLSLKDVSPSNLGTPRGWSPLACRSLSPLLLLLTLPLKPEIREPPLK